MKKQKLVSIAGIILLAMAVSIVHSGEKNCSTLKENKNVTTLPPDDHSGAPSSGNPTPHIV